MAALGCGAAREPPTIGAPAESPATPDTLPAEARADTSAAARDEAAGPTRVVVRNENWLDVTVSAVRGGSTIRLGLVTAKTSAEFPLPEILERSGGDLRFRIDPIGSTESFFSDAVRTRPGGEVELRIESVLGRSSLSAW